MIKRNLRNVKNASLIVLAMILIFTVSTTRISFTDSNIIDEYNEAAHHLYNLGYVGGDEDGNLRLNELVTREEFAKLLVSITGLEDDADELKNNPLFPDVSTSRWSNGYINVVVDRGYLTSKLDGRFHPTDSLTYAEVCASLVKVCGYTSSEISGIWPNNYILKAKNLGISEDISLSYNDNVTRGEAALLVYNLLNSPSKLNKNVTFAEANNLYADCIILETSKTSESLPEDEILTDKGTFYIGDKGIDLEPGERYRLKIEDDIVKRVFENISTTREISVEKISGTTVTYSLGNYKTSTLLPTKATYYYKGKIQSYEAISDVLEVNSSIVLSSNDEGIGYEYGVIYDPVYSDPEVAMNFSLADKTLGSIKFEDGIRITRNGKIIGLDDIEKKDVVYQVSDIWRKNKYILVVDDKVEGEITDIVPNKISPKSIVISNSIYQLSDDMDTSKLTNRGIFQIDDSVTLLLGHDGKVVDIFMNGEEDNSQFALVLNHYTEESKSIEDYGKEEEYVKLLHVDGTTETYKLVSDDEEYNGKLVKYTVVDSDKDNEDDEGFETVELEEVEDIPSKSHIIDKYEKKVDSNYIADNIKIFNLVHNVYGADSTAYLMDWEDLPHGEIESDKIKYLNRVGEFEDINLMFVDNILDEGHCFGVVINTTSSWTPQTGTVKTHTVLINGKEYITNHHVEGMSKGDVVEVKLMNNKIISVENIKYPRIEASSIQAIDSSRIKIKDNIYKFSDSIAIYFRDNNGDYVMKGTDDIEPGKNYGRIAVYLDKSTKYGGKVEMIIVY